VKLSDFQLVFGTILHCVTLLNMPAMHQSKHVGFYLPPLLALKDNVDMVARLVNKEPCLPIRVL
jgi:hypothetical protein